MQEGISDQWDYTVGGPTTDLLTKSEDKLGLVMINIESCLDLNLYLHWSIVIYGVLCCKYTKNNKKPLTLKLEVAL